MHISPEELMKLYAPLSEKDVEIAMLRKQLEELRSQAGETEIKQDDPKYVCLEVDRMCEVLAMMKGNTKLVSVVFVCMLKMMPEGIPQGVIKRMLAAASLENIPYSIASSGDVNVFGTYNNIEKNNNVNF